MIEQLIQRQQHRQEIEANIIGALLIEPALIHETNITPDHFSNSLFKNIFSIMRRHEQFDLLLIVEELEKMGIIGVHSDLMQIMVSVPTTVNFAYYVRRLKEYWVQEEVFKKTGYLQQKAVENNIDEAKQIALEILQLTPDDDEKPFSDTFTQEDYERLANSPRYFSSNLCSLTNYVPFLRGENIYIAGRTSTGKSQLALNLALSFLEQGAKVGYVSMELGREQLLIRLINWEVNSGNIKLHQIDIRQKEWWQLGLEIIKQPQFKNFYFNEELRYIEDISAWIESKKFDVVFLDYIQLIGTRTIRADTRARELGEIAKELRRLSKKRCVVVLSQFNRKDNDDDTEIDLSRIRDSGEIEQTATSVILIRRDKAIPNKFYYAVAKNQTYGALSHWIEMNLEPNGKFIEVI